jgi:hypothetical protein
MSIQYVYPQQSQRRPNSQGATVTVQTPAASIPDGATLVAQISVSNFTQDKPAILATQFNAGTYFVISSVTVSGNPPSSSVIPALVVGYSYAGDSGTVPNSVAGVTSQGSEVVDGYNVTSSVEFDHDGQGVISAGVAGGSYQPNQNWGYAATISIYKVS